MDSSTISTNFLSAAIEIVGIFYTGGFLLFKEFYSPEYVCNLYMCCYL